MMHAASRQSLASLRQRLDAVAGRFSTVDGLSVLASELHSVAGLLTGQPRLRRTLADPSSDSQSRNGLVAQLLASQLSASALQLVQDAVGLRWSSSWDLVDGIEQIADDTLLIAAEQGGTLSIVEDELFRFERILNSEPSLSPLLDEPASPIERRVGLLRDLVAAKVLPVTFTLLEHAVTSGRRHGIEHSIGVLLDAAAARQSRSIARVISAVELSSAQQSRLESALAELYGRSISVRTAVEPAVRGGLVIRVGDEVIDGSVAAQLAVARAALT